MGTLESILASHAMVQTAEGEFFRNVLRGASEASAIPVTGVKESEILGRSASELGLPAEELQRRTIEMGRLLGPPWRQDEKLATLAGLSGLANHAEDTQQQRWFKLISFRHRSDMKPTAIQAISGRGSIQPLLRIEQRL